MPDEALYFPYIEIPDTPSLTRVLLYWDYLGTIVPWSLPDVSARTQELIACELVEEIHPEEEVDRIAGFEDGFVALLDGTGFGPGRGATTRIHRDKATFHLWAELRCRGFVRKDEALGDGGWVEVDKRIGALYMAYLARCLGRRLGREPITDQRKAFAPLAGSALSRHGVALDKMRALVLAGVLPAPAVPVAPKKLAAFKRKNWDKLHAFRLHVEGYLLDAFEASLKAPDDDIRGRRLDVSAGVLEEETRSIESLMKRRWPSKRGLLCAGIAAGPSAAKAGITGDPLEGAAAAAPIVVEIVNAMLGRPPEAMAKSPMAYAALTQKAFATS